MNLNSKNKQKDKNFVPRYLTYALADNKKTDKNTKAKSPSLVSVEQMRDWSIENKL